MLYPNAQQLPIHFHQFANFGSDAFEYAALSQRHHDNQKHEHESYKQFKCDICLINIFQQQNVRNGQYLYDRVGGNI